MSVFKLKYLSTDGEIGKGVMTGPKDKTVEDCRTIAKLAASFYSIDPESFVIEEIPERVSKGFLHPLQAYTPEGRTATISRWYI